MTSEFSIIESECFFDEETQVVQFAFENTGTVSPHSHGETSNSYGQEDDENEAIVRHTYKVTLTDTENSNTFVYMMILNIKDKENDASKIIEFLDSNGNNLLSEDSGSYYQSSNRYKEDNDNFIVDDGVNFQDSNLQAYLETSDNFFNVFNKLDDRNFNLFSYSTDTSISKISVTIESIQAYFYLPIVELTTNISESTDRRKHGVYGGDITIPAGTLLYKKNDINYYFKLGRDFYSERFNNTHVGKATGITYSVNKSEKDYIVYSPALQPGDDFKIRLKVLFEPNRHYMFAVDDFTYYTWPNDGDVPETIGDSYDPPENRNNYFVVSTGEMEPLIDTYQTIFNNLSEVTNYAQSGNEITFQSEMTEWINYNQMNQGNSQNISKINSAFVQKIMKELKTTAVNGESILIPKEYSPLESLSEITAMYRLVNGSSNTDLINPENVVDLQVQPDHEGLYVYVEENELFTLQLSSEWVVEVMKKSDGSFISKLKKNGETKFSYTNQLGESISFQQTNTRRIIVTFSSVKVEFDMTEYTANICFPSGTKVFTDQDGYVLIENLDKKRHTIFGQRIMAISESIGVDNYLVKFQKSCFENQCPLEDTIMTGNHRIFQNGKMYFAKSFLNGKTVTQIPYNGKSLLYNVVLSNNGMLRVNNMMCESLNVHNPVITHFL